jgi:anaerobic selenocysteine-containing dehydrogenase
MLNVMIEENLYDHEFVDLWCYGFDELAAAVKDYTPEMAEKITWVPAEKIREAARLYAELGGIIQWGVAVDQSKQAVPAGQAIAALFEITGNIDKPGTMIAPPSLLAYYAGWGEEILSDEARSKKLGADKYGLIKFGFRNASTDEVLHTIESGEPYPIKAAWIQTSNFLACTAPDPKRTLAAFEKLDFIVGVDLFMTPTLSALADIVLPSVTFAERDGLRLGDGVQHSETINAAIAPVGECKSDMQIDLEISQRWSETAWPWKSVTEMYSSMIGELGLDFGELQEAAPLYLPFEYEKYKKGLLRSDGEMGFQTRTGRIELWSTYLNTCGLSPVPYYEEPEISPISTPDVYGEFPLVLTTGARNWGMFHSEHRQIPQMRALRPDPIVEIHPADAACAGVGDGEWVWIESPYGRCKRKVQTSPTIKQGVINTDHGWWLPERSGALEDGLFGLWDLAVNQLFPYNPGDSGLGCNYKNMLCRITKASSL